MKKLKTTDSKNSLRMKEKEMREDLISFYLQEEFISTTEIGFMRGITLHITKISILL